MHFRLFRTVALVVVLMPTIGVRAQLGLPSRLPSLGPSLQPITRAPVLPRVEPLVDAILAPVDLATTRLDDATRRLRAHRRELDRDPRGELIVRAELLAQPSNATALEALRAAGFTPLRDDALDGLDDALIVMKGPSGIDLADALARARAIDPAGSYDFHHVYSGSGSVGGLTAGPAGAGVPGAAAGDNAATTAVRRPPDAGAPKVGLIDSGVDLAHPALSGIDVRRHGCADVAHPASHGTAVASLIAGSAEHFHSALPRAQLYAADVYCDEPTGGSVEAIARELAWMARMHVAVVNVSLVGPANQILQRLVERAVEQGMLIVAAVGNDGPAAPPLYPASWPGVVGVGAVDGRSRLLPEGARGPQVMFVAPGADMAAAGAGTHTFVPVRGTSFAAPFVAGLLASYYQVASPAGARAAVAHLAATARVLPDAPREGVGRGLLAEGLSTPLDTPGLALSR